MGVQCGGCKTNFLVRFIGINIGFNIWINIGIIIKFIIGFNIGFNIGLNIGFKIEFNIELNIKLELQLTFKYKKLTNSQKKKKKKGLFRPKKQAGAELKNKKRTFLGKNCEKIEFKFVKNLPEIAKIKQNKI